MRKKNTFKDFIEEKYYSTIDKRLRAFIESNQSYVQECVKDNVRVTYVELDSYEIQAVYIQESGLNKISFDVVCTCTVDYSYTYYQGRRSDRDSDQISNVWVVVHGTATLDNLESCSFGLAEPYDKRKNNKPLNGDMVPIISHKEYPKYAIDIIKKYYGNDYDLNIPIDVYDLANRMGLKIIPLKSSFTFSKEKSVFGKLFFEKTEVEFYNKDKDEVKLYPVDENTILYDPKCMPFSSFGSEKITIAHEIVHFELHRKAYLFAKAINKQNFTTLTCLNSNNVDEVAEFSNENESFMEAQANGIAPYLIMPESTFKRKAEELRHYYITNDESEVDYIDRMARDLRDEFGVTLFAIKSRLKDLHFLDNVSALEWNDTKKSYISAVSFKPASLSDNQTYTILEEDFKRILDDNSNLELLGYIYSQNFIFAENRIVFNSPKYVFKDDDGEFFLTDYAKRHIDECALKFDLNEIKNNQTNKSVSSYCYLCKDFKDTLLYDIKLAKIGQSYIDSDNFIEEKEEFDKNKKMLLRLFEDTNECSEVMNKLVELYDYTQKDFTTYVSSSSISRLLSRAVKEPDLKNCIGICLTFNFPPDVSQAFVQKYSKNKLGTDKLSNVYIEILTNLRSLGKNTINKYLTKNGIDNLF